MRWFDGAVWTEHTAAPSTGASNSRGVMGMLVAVLLVIGLVLNLQSVSLLTGTDKVWIGVALVALALVICFVPQRLSRWVVALVVVVLALTVANGVYDEVQLHRKLQQLNNFGH